MADPAPLPPGATIGILGGGQLGRMLALSAAELGLDCHIFCPDPESPAFAVSAARTIAAYDDEAALAAFAAAVDVVTYEFENVPAATARLLASLKPVRPGERSLAVSQDRLSEKALVAGLGLGVPAFAPVDDIASLEAALKEIGRPAVLKTRRLGYDGKGQARIHADTDPAAALAAIGRAAAILEAFVPFEREVSVLVARGLDGDVRVYDVVENRHEDGILAESRVPAAIDAATGEEALRAATAIAEALGHVGLLAVEMFVLPAHAKRRILVNEIAPRVHNSGHWTSDACLVSQFEQHVRAICGWPLGDPARHSDAVMENLIGAEAGDWAALAARPGARLHLYGKREARPGRKMGHLTRIAPRRG